MFTDALFESKPSIKKVCQYCSQKIEDTNEEQYYGNRVYHKACRQTVILRVQHPDVFRQVSEIRTGAEFLLETSPQWMVENSLRIRLIHKAFVFILSALKPKTSHNQLT